MKRIKMYITITFGIGMRHLCQNNKKKKKKKKKKNAVFTEIKGTFSLKINMPYSELIILIEVKLKFGPANILRFSSNP